jgi:hypothetical protein
MGVSVAQGVSAVPVLRSVNFIVDGAGAPITTGSKGYVRIDFDAWIYGWTVVADQAGSIVFDVKKCTYAAFPITTSIVGSEPPTLVAADKAEDLALTTWVQKLTFGDILEFVVDSASTVERATIDLRLQ